MEKQRYPILDLIRGIAIINMIAYHFLWNMKSLWGFELNWFDGRYSHIWQRAICFSFILISGFCLNLSSKPIKRGIIVFMAGLLVSAVTLIVEPRGKIIFGILTFLGSAMIIVGLVAKPIKKINSKVTLILSLILFLITYKINYGIICGLELPKYLYNGLFATYLGFRDTGFYSADYFSLLPWIFLFLFGFCFYDNIRTLPNVSIKPINFIGRHSLLIYLLHQPVIYLTMYFYY